MAAVYPTSSQAQSPRSTARKIFCSERGLRPGWRLALYLTLIVVIGFALHLVFSSVGVEESLPGTFSRAAAFLTLFLPAVVMSKIEKRSIAAYRLPVPEALGKPFLQGCAIGIVEVTILVGLLALVLISASVRSRMKEIMIGARQSVSWSNLIYRISGALVFVFSEEQTKLEQLLALMLPRSSRITWQGQSTRR